MKDKRKRAGPSSLSQAMFVAFQSNKHCNWGIVGCHFRIIKGERYDERKENVVVEERDV